MLRVEDDLSTQEYQLLDISKFCVVSTWPKSGYTYLTKLLALLTGYPLKDFVQFHKHNEQDIYEQRILDSLGTKAIIHQHIKAGENNLLLMEKYKIKPIILVRNIFDSIYSIHDHIEQESKKKFIGYIHKNYETLSLDEKLFFISKICIPWYFNFYISWTEAELSGKIDFMWMTYEELFSSEQKNRVKSILSFWNIEMQDEEIEKCLIKMGNQKTRLNIGKSGRGESLPSSCKEEIISLAKVWKLPSGAFKRIGILE